MKKTALFIAVVSALSLASCKKDHVCACNNTTVSTVGGTATTTTSTNEFTYVEAKKGDAKKACISSTETYTYDNGFATVTNTETSTCELK